MENKKILFYLPTIHPGGVLESNKILAKSFQDAGYEVVIVANHKGSRFIDNLKHYYLESGDIVRIFKLKDIIGKEKPIAVFSNMLPQNVTLSLVKFLMNKKENIKYFGFVRNSTSSSIYGKTSMLPYRFFIKKLYENLDKIIAVSSVVKKDIKEAFFLPEEKIEIIYDPLDIKDINSKALEPLNEEESLIFSKKVLLFIGRFSVQKRLDLLLEIFKDIYKVSSDVNLVLVGDGEEKEKLVSLTKKYGINDRVFFLPFTSNPYKYMSRAFLFTLTSQDEGFGRVVAESLACGTPVVAYSNEMSGHKDIIIHGKNGLLIPFGEKEKFVNSIALLLNNNSLYLKYKQNTNTSVTKFSSENVMKQLESLIYK